MIKICILDVPAIIFISFFFSLLYAKYLIKKNPDVYFFGYSFFIGIFYLNAILSNLNIIKPWFFGIYSEDINWIIGVFYLLSYPLWFSFGTQRCYGLFGKNPSEGGLFWFIGFKDKTEQFKKWG